MNNKLLIGIAVNNFTYGHATLLKIIDVSEDEGTRHLSTNNLQNKDIDDIQTGEYHSTNQISVVIPDYMAYEFPCGCSKCHPSKGGRAGEKFLLIKMAHNSVGAEYAVISRLS